MVDFCRPGHIYIYTCTYLHTSIKASISFMCTITTSHTCIYCMYIRMYICIYTCTYPCSYMRMYSMHCIYAYLFTDPCNPNPCGSSGICFIDGTSYGCICGDGDTRTTACVNPTSTAPMVMMSSTSSVITSVNIQPTTTPIPSSGTYCNFYTYTYILSL